ncbi:MAG: hypothetical protein SPL96_11830 [Bacteroidales bacterium]|nr:hypothetical protein [Bacteroidales bacterium]
MEGSGTRQAMTSDQNTKKNERRHPSWTSPLLRGGYLRLPMSLDGGVVTLRALCQEREGDGNSISYHVDNLAATTP